MGIEKSYSDGWARVQNITQHRRRGMVPLGILTPIKSGPTQTVNKSEGVWQSKIVELPEPIDPEVHDRGQSLNKTPDPSIKSKASTDHSDGGSLRKKVAFDLPSESPSDLADDASVL